MEKVPMTQAGYTTLVEEVKRLKTIERPAVVKAIEEAREHGDLSENAEYHAARERQSFIEGRIGELEGLVSTAEVIDYSTFSGDTVRFGATVTVADMDNDEESTYQIVGETEADIKSGLISISSPLGNGMIGKSVGDTIEVTAPGGSRGYEIVGVTFK
jgi:transcription elongation factor GreA